MTNEQISEFFKTNVELGKLYWSGSKRNGNAFDGFFAQLQECENYKSYKKTSLLEDIEKVKKFLSQFHNKEAQIFINPKTYEKLNQLCKDYPKSLKFLNEYDIQQRHGISEGEIVGTTSTNIYVRYWLNDESEYETGISFAFDNEIIYIN